MMVGSVFGTAPRAPKARIVAGKLASLALLAIALIGCGSDASKGPDDARGGDGGASSGGRRGGSGGSGQSGGGGAPDGGGDGGDGSGASNGSGGTDGSGGVNGSGSANGSGGSGGMNGSGGSGGMNGSGGVNGSGGATVDGWYSLAIGSPPLLAESTLETARAVTRLVPRSGGTLEATAANGTKYRLTIPDDALLEDTSITMTPLATLTVTDMTAEGFAGVQFAPEGLSFMNGVILEITPPTGTTWPIREQVPIGFGANNRVSLALMDPASNAVKFVLQHFSSYALLLAKKGFDATLNPARHRLGGDAEERIASAVAEKLGRERQLQLLGVSEGGDAVPGFEEFRNQYYNEVLKPRIDAAGDSCANGRLALQTLLGFERQHQLLGAEFSGYSPSFDAVFTGTIAKTAEVCMKEEYEICRDEHIITRILPSFLGLWRQAALMGYAEGGPESLPMWLRQAEDYVRRCLQFELRFDGSVAHSTVGYPKHNMSESVTSTVKISYGMSFLDPIPDSPASIANLGALLGGQIAPMTASGYSVTINEDCVQLDSKQMANGQFGVSFMSFEPGEGSVVERAKVKDFGLSVALYPNLSQFTYTARYRNSQGSCVDPNPSTSVESFSTTAGGPFLQRFTSSDEGAYIKGWSVVQGGDIIATKDVSFSASAASDDDTSQVTVHLILFHKPL